jgi:hypothetical protein
LFFGVTKDWPFWKTDVGSFFETIHLLFYMVPAGLFMFIAAIAGNATAGIEGDPGTVWVLSTLGLAVVALIYSLLIGAVLWIIKTRLPRACAGDGLDFCSFGKFGPAGHVGFELGLDALLFDE